MKKVFVAQPAYGAGCFEREAYDAPSYEADDFDLVTMPYESSLLAHGFNKCLCACLNVGGFDEWALLHGDVVPSMGFIGTLIAERDAHSFDAIHAPCAIKDGRGLTSTAIAYSSDRWEKKRRLSTKELHALPETFSIDDVRERLDPAAFALLPNTGCLLFSAKAPWLDTFPGFEIKNKIERTSGSPLAHVVSEDWDFGYWMAENGLRVGATRKVKTRHIGKIPYMTEVVWGVEHDEQFFDKNQAA